MNKSDMWDQQATQWWKNEIKNTIADIYKTKPTARAENFRKRVVNNTEFDIS